jgi:hypothetical protein
MHQLINEWRLLMNRPVDAHLARTQFGQIMDRAVENTNACRRTSSRAGCGDHECSGFIRTAAPPPDWLEKAWNGAKKRGLEKLSAPEIDAEITAYRREKRN